MRSSSRAVRRAWERWRTNADARIHARSSAGEFRGWRWSRGAGSDGRRPQLVLRSGPAAWARGPSIRVVEGVVVESKGEPVTMKRTSRPGGYTRRARSFDNERLEADPGEV